MTTPSQRSSFSSAQSVSPVGSEGSAFRYNPYDVAHGRSMVPQQLQQYPLYADETPSPNSGMDSYSSPTFIPPPGLDHAAATQYYPQQYPTEDSSAGMAQHHHQDIGAGGDISSHPQSETSLAQSTTSIATSITPPSSLPPPPSYAESATKPAVLHTRLSGLCSYIPYPPASHPVHQRRVPKNTLTRVFLGQLPYFVTAMQLCWLCDTLAPGVEIYNVEMIVKKMGRRCKKLPTGCVHVLVHPDNVDRLLESLTHRVLFDDTGVWCAQTPEEQEQLQSYCTSMKENIKLRFRDRPYQPVVVQVATSVSTKKKGKKAKNKLGSEATSPCHDSTPPSTAGSGATPVGVTPTLPSATHTPPIHPQYSSPPSQQHSFHPCDLPFEEEAYLGAPMSSAGSPHGEEYQQDPSAYYYYYYHHAQQQPQPQPQPHDQDGEPWSAMVQYSSHNIPMECEHTQQYNDQ